MRVEVESNRQHGMDMPQALRLSGRRVAVEVIDQWFGSDYRYCKVKAEDGAVYILRVIEHLSEWQLTLFVSPRAQARGVLSGT